MCVPRLHGAHQTKGAQDSESESTGTSEHGVADTADECNRGPRGDTHCIDGEGQTGPKDASPCIDSEGQFADQMCLVKTIANRKKKDKTRYKQVHSEKPK